MRITEKIHAIKHSFIIPLNPNVNLDRFVYSLVIFEENGIQLVDSGVIDSEEKIFNCIKEKGRSVAEIKNLILTHSHPDHIGSAAVIKEKTNCKVLAHPGEREWIENVDKQFMDRPVPGFKSLVNRSVNIDAFLDDGAIFKTANNMEIRIIHTPGHSRGSISLLFPDEKVLMTADSILLPGDLPIYEDYVDAVASVRKLKDVIGVDILLSSWAEPVSKDLISQTFDKSIAYLDCINMNIESIDNPKDLQPMELCKAVIEKMNMPPAAVNPFVAKSFQSNLR